MGKLIKVVVLLGILVAAVAVYVHYAKSGEDNKTATNMPVQKKEPAKDGKGGIQVQEKYGFAPVGE